MEKGYIYIRSNKYWSSDGVYKFGKTKNIIDRETSYITTETKRGFYVSVIEVDLNILDKLELRLMKYFYSLGLYFYDGGGVEFFKKDIIKYIYPYLDKHKIKYRILSNEEINELTRTIRIYNRFDDILDTSSDSDNNTSDEDENINSDLDNEAVNNIVNYKPRKYQTEIINKSYDYYKNNNKGLLVIPCGVGKTLLSLWIAIKLISQTILIGVPNTLLLKQWLNVVKILFHNVPYLLVCGGVEEDDIINFITKYKNKCIIITTYSSSKKLKKAISKLKNKFIFDMKINDECHHLSGGDIDNEDKNNFLKMLKIKAKKQLSLTATLKVLENRNDKLEEDIIISNNSIEYFGQIIDRKSLLWAINNHIICDYVIQTMITNETYENEMLELDIIDENDQRLFFSAYAALKSIYDKNSHHLLIYSNCIENSNKIIQYIDYLIENNYFQINDFYHSSYHSELKSLKQKEILDKFTKSKYGVISNVYTLGEGVDIPLLDGVVFGENMTSNIRIVQSALRASRKNINESNKITKIILPILNKFDWLDNTENSDFRKVREVIYQMSLEDETIEQKIKVYKINIEKHDDKKDIENKNDEDKEEDENNDYDDELTKKLRLKITKRMLLGITYEKAKRIIQDRNIKCKEEYYKLCNNDSRLPKEPESEYGSKFVNWIDYLSIKRTYYDLETCKTKINEYLSKHPELKNDYLNLNKIVKILCETDILYPPLDLWIDYYNINNLNDILKIDTIKIEKINLDSIF